MRFLVPQFIDVEDKVFGPLTLKQAIYLAGALAVAVALLIRYGLFMTILIAGPLVAFASALAFLKINDQPFVNLVFAAFFYTIRNRLYLWKKTPQKHTDEARLQKPAVSRPNISIVSQSKLKELAWSLDTRNSMYTTEDQWR